MLHVVNECCAISSVVSVTLSDDWFLLFAVHASLLNIVSGTFITYDSKKLAQEGTVYIQLFRTVTLTYA